MASRAASRESAAEHVRRAGISFPEPYRERHSQRGVRYLFAGHGSVRAEKGRTVEYLRTGRYVDRVLLTGNESPRFAGEGH